MTRDCRSGPTGCVKDLTKISNMNEEWRPIEGFNGDYLISNHGRVRSLKRNGDRVMPMTIQRKGYYAVTFSHKSKAVCRKVHRLVAEAFIPNPKNLPQINHKDGDKLNNNVSNLEWCTAEDNVRHSWNTGLCSPHGPSEEGKERLRRLWSGIPKGEKGQRRQGNEV